jgi:ABC-2 type transport system permease protein
MYLLKAGKAVPGYITFLIGSMIFWDILYRSQQAVTISFLEDIWARNLLNVFVSPIRVSEFIAATYIVGFIKILVIVALLTVLAYSLYSFNLFVMGVSLIPLFVNLLLMGWAIGMMTTALIMRWGQSAEALAWGVPFLIQPVCAVFYPLNILPKWLQPVSLAIPATHVFEGMRQVLENQAMPIGDLWAAFGLNLIYLAAGALIFNRMFDVARRKGLLAKLGTQ